jgi:hypothetical protein
MICMEPISTMTLQGCYKPSVNESETITEAQPFCWVRNHSEPASLRAFGFASPVPPCIERS